MWSFAESLVVGVFQRTRTLAWKQPQECATQLFASVWPKVSDDAYTDQGVDSRVSAPMYKVQCVQFACSDPGVRMKVKRS